MYKRRQGRTKTNRNICIVCESVQNEEVGVIFHGLPKIPFYRQKWIELCDINVELNDVNKVYVCSKHFQESDYTLRRDGFKQLRRGSIPFMKNCNGSDGSVNGDKIFCSENSLGEAESVKIDSVQHDHNYHARDNIETFCESDMLVDNEVEVFSEEMVDIKEVLVEDQTISERPETPVLPSPYRQTDRIPRYIGDIYDAKFSTPRPRRRTISFIKDKYTKTILELKKLRQHSRRLKVRAKSLKSLIATIRKKKYV